VRRRRGRGDESGQALVEFALVLPLLALIMGIAFNGWNGMQLGIGLTSAARAGAVQAANELAGDVAADPAQPPTAAQVQNAWDDATNAVNKEEGGSAVYQNTNPNATNYVAMSEATETIQSGATMNVVRVTISGVSFDLVPVVGNIAVTAHAAARYS